MQVDAAALPFEDGVKGLLQGTPTVTAIEEHDARQLPFIVKYLEDEITKQFGTTSLQVQLRARVVTGLKK